MNPSSAKMHMLCNSDCPLRAGKNCIAMKCDKRTLSSKVAMKLLIPLLALAFAVITSSSTISLKHRSLAETNIDTIKKSIVLLGIFSSPSGGEKRKNIRDSYLSDNRFCKLEDYVQQQSTKASVLNNAGCNFVYVFVITDTSDDFLQVEDAPFITSKDSIESDCIFLDQKQKDDERDGWGPTFMKFVTKAAHEYGIDYVVKLDDEFLLSTDLFAQFVEEELPPAPHNIRIYGGPHRQSRFKNHRYTAGEFYFMSSDLADYIANEMTAEMRRKLSIYIEDLDMRSYVHSHPRPLKQINTNTFLFYHHACNTKKCFQEFQEHRIQTLPGRDRAMSWEDFCLGVLRAMSN